MPKAKHQHAIHQVTKPVSQIGDGENIRINTYRKTPYQRHPKYHHYLDQPSATSTNLPRPQRLLLPILKHPTRPHKALPYSLAVPLTLSHSLAPAQTPRIFHLLQRCRRASSRPDNRPDAREIDHICSRGGRGGKWREETRWN